MATFNPLILALSRERQTDLCEFKVTLGYRRVERYGDSHFLIPALGRWRQEVIWVDRQRSIR